MEELKKKEGEKKGREERNVYQLKKWDSSHGQLPPSPSSACDIFAHPICDTISLLINKTWTKSQNQFCSYLIERNTSNKDRLNKQWAYLKGNSSCRGNDHSEGSEQRWDSMRTQFVWTPHPHPKASSSWMTQRGHCRNQSGSVYAQHAEKNRTYFIIGAVFLTAGHLIHRARENQTQSVTMRARPSAIENYCKVGNIQSPLGLDLKKEYSTKVTCPIKGVRL